MTPPIEAVIDALVNVGRPAMSPTWGPDSCIAAAAITIEALDAFGYRARPVAVETQVYNAIAAAWRESWPDGRRTGDPPEGAWSVGLGMVESGPVAPSGLRKRGLTTGREVHVVALAGTYVIDLSIDQARRPKRGLGMVRPMAFDLGDDSGVARFLAGESVGWTLDGWTVIHKARPRSVTWWMDSPNWRRRDAAIRSRVVGAVIRAVREGPHG